MTLNSSSLIARLQIKRSAAIFVAASFIVTVNPTFDGGIGVAISRADDDGGGRSRSDRDRGGRADIKVLKLKKLRLPGFFTQKKRRSIRRSASRPRAVQPVMTEERNSLVALGLRVETLDALTTSGFRVIERRSVPSLETEMIKLGIPSRVTLTQAREQVRGAQPGAVVDFNHFYRPEADNCDGKRCLVRHLAGWPATTEGFARCKPTQPIGLIDTRINADHPSLADSRITSIPLDDREIASGANHGTAVAALLVGRGDVSGLLPDWELIAVDAFRKNDVADSFDLVRAVDMLVARKVGVINMSLSGPPNLLLEKMLAAAAARDIVLVAAAGNDGPRAMPLYPAAYPEVIAVTAIDRNKRPYRRAAQGDHIDIAAPGVSVWTAASVKGQKPRSGTSFASPFVASAAALIRAANPGFSNQEIEIVLQNEAEDLGSPGKDTVFGWGLVDVSRVCR